MRRISAVKDCKAPAERAERANKAIIDLGEIISAQQVLNKLMSWLSGRDTLGRYGEQAKRESLFFYDFPPRRQQKSHTKETAMRCAP